MFRSLIRVLPLPGVLFALGACFIWGFIFVVPHFMAGFSSIEIALGRYFVFGIVSSIFFLKSFFQGACRYPASIWLKALFFSLLSTVGYYVFVVLALRYSSPASCALILGISPIAITLCGNWRHKEVSFKSLAKPSALILIGLVIINIPHLEIATSPAYYFLGLLFSLFALASWTWFVLANYAFLKQQPHVHSSDWTTMIGISSLFWVFLFACALTPLHLFDIKKYFTIHPDLINFIIGSTILGVFCSWLGAFLWNKASLHLPVSLAGQLTIFETIFGVTFVYLFTHTIPSLQEMIGILILLSSIIYSLRQAKIVH